MRGENDRVICDTERRMHLVVKFLLQLNLVTAEVVDDTRVLLGLWAAVLLLLRALLDLLQEMLPLRE